MTNARAGELTCAICGLASEQNVFLTTSMFGSPDLDLRPPPPHGANLALWVQLCPHCGHCARDISEALDGAADVIRSAAYRAELDHPERPALASAFLCLALIHEAAGQLAHAGQSALEAAWVCDDEAALDAARDCRRRSIAYFERARTVGSMVTEQHGGAEMLLADIHRRAGLFADAQKLCADGMAKADEEQLKIVLEFEARLARAGDAEPHAIEEAFPPRGDSPDL